MNREWAMPSGNTFSIPPIKDFVERYLHEGQIVIDPFANSCKYGTITNDLNPEYDTDYHMEALDFLKMIETESADVVLYDPPYSTRQVKELYQGFGKDKLIPEMTNTKYWQWCKDEVARILKPDGVCLSFGWNSNGLGMVRDCNIIEILLVAHGGIHNDTICVAERKNGQYRLFD